MPLDAAEFISELSIVDPPGTDPLNQGDDHIRTTKKAVQQSFPNVGSAVPQTGAQMAQMAIKNEVNTFTQTNIFSARNDFQNIRFDAAAGTTRGLQYYLGGLQAWAVSNNFNVPALQFQRHDIVTGVFVDTPLSIDQTTGIVSFVQRATFLGGIKSNASMQIDTVDSTRSFNFQNSGSNYWQIQHLNDASANLWRLRRNDVFGTRIDDPISVQFADGQINFAGQVIGTQRIQLNNVNFVQRHSADRGFAFERQSDSQTEWIMQCRGTSNDWRLQRHVAGVSFDTPISVRFTDGGVFLNTLPTVNPGGTNQLWKSSGFVAIT